MMSYSFEEIKADLNKIDVKQFYMKHIVRSENWYFEKILEIPDEKIIAMVDDFKMLVSDSLKVSFNSIMMVGSGKTGYSFAPGNGLRAFINDGEDGKTSDIDIAIISSALFGHFWDVFRKAYNTTNRRKYNFISRGIFRGYISDIDLLDIDLCRMEWQEISNDATRKLQQQLYFKHEIHYRIYRSWEDFEEYNIQSLNLLKTEVIGNV